MRPVLHICFLLLTASVILVTRQMLKHLLAQEAPVEMGVELGGGYAFVAQHALYGTQVGTAFKQMGGKGVAQGGGEMCLVMPACAA